MAAVNEGRDQGYYFEELKAFWPQTYNLVEQCFFGQEYYYSDDDENAHRYDKVLAQGNYFLDFLDSRDTTFGK